MSASVIYNLCTKIVLPLVLALALFVLTKVLILTNLLRENAKFVLRYSYSITYTAFARNTQNKSLESNDVHGRVLWMMEKKFGKDSVQELEIFVEAADYILRDTTLHTETPREITLSDLHPLARIKS